MTGNAIHVWIVGKTQKIKLEFPRERDFLGGQERPGMISIKSVKIKSTRM
jgi:hypothetical protein